MSPPIRARGSIRRRLTLQLLASAALLAILLFLIVQSFARQLAVEAQDNILAASVASILDSASVQSGGATVDIPYSAFTMLDNAYDERVFYRIESEGETLTGYDDLPVPDRAALALGPWFLTTDFRGSEVRVVSAARRLSIGGSPVEIVASVAQTRDGQARTLERISRSAMILGIGFFAVAAALAVWAGQATAWPLRKLAASVARRGPQDLRPVISDIPSEMVPLLVSLNDLIERLNRTLMRTEEFIAEAAHRVRTPLATVRAHAENTLRRIDKDENRASLREMIRAIDESSRAAGQLLDHAMVSLRADHLDTSPIDLGILVGDLVERLRPVADLKDIDLSFRSDGAVGIRGDAILIQNAVRNIFDNSIKYSPPESSIAIALEAQDGRAVLRVQDQGIGFPRTGAEGLTARFARGDNVAGVVGSGLGLTIAEEVATAHDGALRIGNNENGRGACVTLSLPLG